MRVRERSDDTVAVGDAIETQPGQGTAVEVGSTVLLEIGDG